MKMDKALHEAYGLLRNCCFKSLKSFIGKESIWKFYYAENELYVLKNTLAKELEIYFIKAKSPKEAYEILTGKNGNEKL